MKALFLFLLFCITTNGISQTKDLVILDKVSQKPIDLVQVFYPNLDKGSITNADGKVKIPLLGNEIVASHLNYIEKKFSFNFFKQKDTLYLIPKTNELNEVVIYNLDLKQTCKDILENSYINKYSTKKVVHACTYKEVFNVNDSLSRLYQAQIDWYSKNSLFKNNITIDKQNIIKLKSIDYSKILELDKSIVNTKGAYIENKIFFQFAHLNILLELLINLTVDYDILSIQKNGNTNTVCFNATLKQKGKIIYKHKNSIIVFDNDYKAIKQLKFNMIYETDYEDDFSEIYKVPYKKKTESHILELSFKKLKNKKYSISYYISKLNGVIKTENTIDKIISEQSLFVTESRLGEKLKKGVIDFYKPLYQNIPNQQKANDVKLILSEKEKEFIAN